MQGELGAPSVNGFGEARVWKERVITLFFQEALAAGSQGSDSVLCHCRAGAGWVWVLQPGGVSLTPFGGGGRRGLENDRAVMGFALESCAWYL